jgi:biopolymer transport protein ExbB
MTCLSIESLTLAGAKTGVGLKAELFLGGTLPLANTGADGGVMGFLATGGYVMLLIVLCSMATLAMIVLAGLRLQGRRVLPPEVLAELAKVPDYAAKGDIRPLQRLLEANDSPLARVGALAVSGSYSSREECSQACASRAREELHRLEQGIPVLEMMVTVAPLLGLMGTTAALVGMFSAFGGDGDAGPDTAAVAHEIGVALRCTIAGLFVAVPSVLAHTFFTRKLDGYAVRMGSVLDRAIHDFFTHFEVRRTD